MRQLDTRPNSVGRYGKRLRSYKKTIEIFDKNWLEFLRRRMSNWRVLLLVAAALSLASGDTKPSQLTSFRPISQSEYEAILRLTDGKPVVSEGRLISGGLAALAGLTSGWVTSLRFPNIFGSFGAVEKAPSTSYPLCVIKTEEAIESGNEYHGHHEYHEQNHNRHGRSPDAESHESHDSHESAEHEYQLYVQEQQHAADHSSEYENSELNAGSSSSSSSIESVWNDNKMPPVVNCIVVLKENKHYEEEYTTTTKRPKHHRKKHKQYYKYSHSPPLPAAYETPSSPLSAYPSKLPPPSGLYAYPSLSGPYTAPPSPGSYNNNPWYWQTPHYSPYYSDPRSNAGIYPTAYTGIYAAANPSAYPAAYPSTYPSVIVAPATRSNPNPYYDTTSSSYLDITPSAYSSITHNTQPSGDTSSYTGVESPIHMEISTSNLETANTKPYKQVKARTDMSLKAKKQVVGNLHASSKQKSKRPTRAHPLIEHNSETQSPITRRPTKVKRDEQSIQSNSYAKIASYSESGYQLSLYPQNSYQSNYPKVSYTHALPYPAPVYVRNSIDESKEQTNTKQRYEAYEPDSEENDDPSEFITARKNY